MQARAIAVSRKRFPCSGIGAQNQSSNSRILVLASAGFVVFRQDASKTPRASLIFPLHESATPRAFCASVGRSQSPHPLALRREPQATFQQLYRPPHITPNAGSCPSSRISLRAPCLRPVNETILAFKS